MFACEITRVAFDLTYVKVRPACKFPVLFWARGNDKFRAPLNDRGLRGSCGCRVTGSVRLAEEGQTSVFRLGPAHLLEVGERADFRNRVAAAGGQRRGFKLHALTRGQ